MKIAVIGGGAAGFFAAIKAAQELPSAEVCIFEANAKPLAKVRISGGGRCNVTHGCFDVEKFVSHYPRGARELRAAFHRFQAADTVEWFESRGVRLKRESDGRMFPISDSSQTIIDCLVNEARKLGVQIQARNKVSAVKHVGESFSLNIADKPTEIGFNRVVLTPGGAKAGHRIVQELGHKIVSPVPSLFTFGIDDSRLQGLSGLSTDNASLALCCGGKTFEAEGPLLVTHWGLSGPAVLRLSAWAARELFESNYHAKLTVNWLGKSKREIWEDLVLVRDSSPKKKPRNTAAQGVAKRLWHRLLEAVQISEEKRWAEVGNKTLKQLQNELAAGTFQVSAKGAFKEEFVTCGGVDLSEVDFATMESKVVPGLHLAGEILDIDGLTGGFNFQSAWTTGYLAGEGVSTF